MEWFGVDLYVLCLWLLVIAIFLYSYSYLTKESWKHLPPGPPALPLVGSLPFLGSDLREPLKKMAVKYGDIFTVYLGRERAIVLNGYKIMKQAFVTKGGTFSGRPSNFYVTEIAQRHGLAATQGHCWREQKRLTQHVLHDMGVGGTILEDRVIKEAECLIQFLRQMVGKPYYPQEIIQMTTANTIGYILFGRRQEYDDPKLNKFLQNLDLTYKLAAYSGIVDMIPILRYLPGDIVGFKQFIKTSKEMYAEYQLLIDEKKAAMNARPDIPASFIGAYIQKIQGEENNSDTVFTERQLISVVHDLYLAGSETASNTIVWAILYLARDLNIQARVHSTIDDVIGKNAFPKMSDAASMPYVEACIWESQRLADILPLGFIHSPVDDVELGGYHIPKDTLTIPFMHGLHTDPELYPQPEEFRPERFLSADGKLQKPEEFVPFFMGKRMCIGESLGRMELFLFFTMIMKHFSVRLAPGYPPPDTRGEMGMTNKAKPFHVIFEARQ